MNPQIILEIIKLSLELTIKIRDDIPPERRAEMWETHFKNIEFWQNLFVKRTNVNEPKRES